MQYPISEGKQDLKALFWLSLRHYLPLLRRLFPWLLLFVAVKDLNLYWTLVSTNRLVLTVMFYVQIIAMAYLLCCMFRVTHFYLLGSSFTTIDSAMEGSVGACLKVLLFFLLIGVSFFFLLYIGSLVQKFVFQVHLTSLYQARGGGILVYLMFLSFLLAYTLIRFIFVIPLWSIYNMTFLDAIVRSNELSGRYWLRLFFYYAFVLLPILFSSQTTKLAFWAAQYYSNFFLDLILLSILIPLATSVLLLLQDDLTARVDVAEST